MVNLKINNIEVSVPEGTTILEAAKANGINIPTLCNYPDLGIKAECRVCVVEVEGRRGLSTSCSTPCENNMVVKTNTPDVITARRTITELILANHDVDCPSCPKNLNCELQTLANRLNIVDNPFDHVEFPQPTDESNPSIVRNPNRCIKCGRCIEVCRSVQGIDVLEYMGRGVSEAITPAYGHKLNDLFCTYCGQCSSVCPVGAIVEKNDTDLVFEAINDPTKHVIVQTAPAIRVSLGEEDGMNVGSIVTGKLVSALRVLGFDEVFDTDFTADLTIIEEGNELIQRITTGGVLPMMTSCCPGWINFAEQHYPEILPNISTCKSPQQMFGALAKSYYAEKIGVDPKDLFVVSIMPCTAKKYECKRDEMQVNKGIPDVDVVLTTRELGKMIRQVGIDFEHLPESEFDAPFGITTGAAAIFGATGGVMEAAIRTVYEVVNKEELKSLDFTSLRGLDGIKEATVTLGGKEVKVAVCHTLSKARILAEQVKNGTSPYAFIEVMACPGGCIGGGGQPYGTINKIRSKRIEATYNLDKDMPIRKSHENPAIKAIYEDYLEKPLGHKSHHLLHTNYAPRGEKK